MPGPPRLKPSTKPCIDCVSQGITTKRKTAGPGPRCATHRRAKRFDRRTYTHSKHILETYNLTAEEYQAIYEFQGGRCAICRRATGVKRKLSVDHDHKTGIIRGLLCTMCNKYILGWARDCIEMLQRAIDYLRKPPAVQVIGERIAPIEAEKLSART